jgi:hypothetical protein
MPYDASLDTQVFAKTYDYDGGKIIVSVYSYNNGPKKLQITREVKDREGKFTFTKLGRLAKDEIESILPLIKEAMENM